MCLLGDDIGSLRQEEKCGAGLREEEATSSPNPDRQYPKVLSPISTAKKCLLISVLLKLGESNLRAVENLGGSYYRNRGLPRTFRGTSGGSYGRNGDSPLLLP